MRLPLVGSVDLLQLPAQTVRALQGAAQLVPRMITLIGEAEDVLGELRAVTRDVQETQRQAAAVLGDIRKTQAQFAELIAQRIAMASVAESIIDQPDPAPTDVVVIPEVTPDGVEATTPRWTM